MERRLSAILAADMVGYSRLMEADETGTIERQKAHRRELIDPAFQQYHGRIVKEMGDGILVEFGSVVDAVSCALVVQRAMPERETDVKEEYRITYRIGINLGDVVVEGDDLFGDGVNVAARLEQFAEPGGICISGTVHDHIEGRSKFVSNFLGEQQLKNISRPIRAYRVSVSADDAARETALPSSPILPEKPSIAVLPFNSLSSDPEQEFFADGIGEELIMALSRFHWLFVIARNSSFSYKGKNIPIRQVSSDLGVRYVVEGSVRSSPTRLRVSVQLIDALTDQHVWAENYDRPTGDLFDLQDEIAQSITGVLVPALGSAERERSMRADHPDLDAWQAYQKGLAHYFRPYTDADHTEARRLFDRAIELDPGFSDAYAMIGLMGVYALVSGQSSYDSTEAEILDNAEQAARLAIQYGDNNALAHMVMGRIYGLRGDLESAIAECETAVRLNAGLAIAHHELGVVLLESGRYADAVSSFDQAIKLSPNDPSRWNFYLLKGNALSGMGEFEEAIVYLKEAARQRPKAFWPYVNLSGTFFALGRKQEARAAMAEARKRKPNLSAKLVVQQLERLANPPAHLRKWVTELSKADLLD